MASITEYGSKHSHEFTLTVNETSTDVANNTSDVSFSFTCYKSSYSWSSISTVTYSIDINGNTYTGNISSYSAGSPLTIRSGSVKIPHNADGSKTISYSFSVVDNSGRSYCPGNASASGTMTLTTLARKPVLQLDSIDQIGLNSARVKYTVKSGDFYHIEYSLNSGSWRSASGNPYITITGLSPNTSYSVRVRGRNQSKTLTGDASNSKSFKTLDIARITNLPNFEHGNNINMTINNPAKISSLLLKLTVGGSIIFQNKSVSTGSNSIALTDDELDQIYKKYGELNNISAVFVLSGGGYSDNNKNCTITLTGKQKNGWRRVNGSWRRCYRWRRVNGSWRRVCRWRKINGAWRRCI